LRACGRDIRALPLSCCSKELRPAAIIAQYGGPARQFKDKARLLRPCPAEKNTVASWRYHGSAIAAGLAPGDDSANLGFRSAFGHEKDAKMRAAYYEQNGPAKTVLKLGEIETPRPGPGEVRVKLATSGVNPSDVKARSGATRKIAYPRVIPHSDGAGEIDLVGDGVSATRVGERVWVWNGQWLRPFGTCAEYIVLPAAQAVRLPAKTGFEVGACLGIPAMTAYHAIAVAGAAPGVTLLIAGGAGAVGHYAVQFAKAAGATVIATVSSAEKADTARAAGADHTIDYRRENVGERVMAITGKKGVDAIVEVDFAANAMLAPHVLRERGTIVIYGTGSPQSEIPGMFFLRNAITLKFIYVYELNAAERTAALGAITRGLEAGALVTLIGKTFPLADIVAAHEAVESGKILGNVVVNIA
jgi:NADPH2:quinone reductase